MNLKGLPRTEGFSNPFYPILVTENEINISEVIEFIYDLEGSTAGPFNERRKSDLSVLRSGSRTG